MTDSVVTLPLGQLGPQLPKPHSERYAPLRLGIVNIWQYDYQEWWLEGGNLLLRGDNTVGKTKVIELTLPFLLDAQMHPNRLDPFGQREGRSMHWNLLEDGALGHGQREGFTWIEFGRLDADGREHYTTIGAWLRASSSSTKVDAAYFVTPMRPGQDLFFPKAGEATIGREGLRRQVGEIFTTRRDYQAAVDQAMYGLGVDRYREMVDLLLQLRQPKLSAVLKPSKLTNILTDSLPPVDEEQIASLAQQYEQLEEYQAHIEELERSERGVDSYLRTYRTYIRRQVRRAADELRNANHFVEDEAKRLDALGKALDKAQGARQALEAEQSAAREAKDAVTGRLDAARQAPEMKSVLELEQVRSEAERSLASLEESEGDLARAAEDVQAARADLQEAEEDLRPANEQLTHAQHAAEKAASNADLTVLHAAAVGTLLANPDSTQRRLRAQARAKRDQADDLRALSIEIVPVETIVASVRDQLGEADASADLAREATTAADTAVDVTAEAHLAAIQRWQSELREIWLSEEESRTVHEHALGLEIDPGSLIATARQRAASALEVAVGASLATTRQLEREVAGVDQQIADLEQQTEITPPPPRVRTSARDARPGAPFYRCVDFRASLAPEQAALLEAGLEAAGVLDAWVWPDGTLESEVIDTSILGGDRAQQSLVDYLVPVEGVLRAGVIDKILASLGSTPDAGNFFIALDGSWQLGNLQGRAYKAEAAFVGASAREQARARKLAELADARHGIADQLETERGSLAELRGRQRLLSEEANLYPSRSSYLQARREAESAWARLEAATAQVRQLKEQEARLSARLQELRIKLNSRATELGLIGHLDHLPELLVAIRSYEEQITTLWMAATKLINLRRAGELAGKTIELRELNLQRETEKVERRRRDSARAKARAEELESSVAGRDALDALGRVEALRAELRQLEEAIEDRTKVIVAAAKAEGDAEGELRSIHERHQASTERRAKAAQVITDLTLQGAIDLALNTAFPAEGDWSMSRALDLARHQIEPALQNEPSHEEAINNAHTNLMGAFGDLVSTLHEYAPSMTGDAVFPQTFAIYNQVQVDIRVLRQRLHEEIESQRRLLTEKEKDIFEHFLMADLATHLRERILRARSQVQDINANLRAHPTNNGMTLSLRLTEEVEGSNDRAALEYLMKDPSLLRDHEREILRGFFQGRIAAARVQEGNQTWREHLSEALDYRRWHKLTIHQHLDGKTSPFTDARYAAGSGGEKSVSIHQPLFAAAATYYDSASTGWAPRLIVLDEAFAGIDFPTRGRCLEMAEQFDLDLVMTSYEEMGTHEEVLALAIYQMVRDPARRGVYCERWVWNGHELQQGAEGA